MGFGELALIYNDKRSASIVAEGDCECYTLDGSIFKSIVISSNMNKRTQQAGFLNSIKLFDQLDKEKKLKLVDGLKTKELPQGSFIFKEGDVGNEFYIIEKGQVDCLLGPEMKNVRTLKESDHFGEIALIQNMPRSLSIKAKTEVRLLMLDRDTFTRILGSIEQNLKKDYDV